MTLSKHQVIISCRQKLEERIANAGKAMQAAQDAANNEEKSSAGDKYETSRAMGQLDRDMNARQLAIARTELAALLKIDPEKQSETVVTGSICYCGDAVYFIAVGLGVISVEGEKVTVLSPGAPITKLLAGKRKNDQIHFNGKDHIISAVY